jgi:response regulator RpfG family c-di-GMP phosphodiesterase
MQTLTSSPIAMYIGSPYDSRLLLAGLIRIAGFEVVVAYHNENISKQIEKLPRLDLVVLDSIYMNFDGENSVKFMEQYVQIKADTKTQNAPLIIVTMENEFDKELLDRLDADKHIVKPVDVDEFIKVIGDYLNK